MKLLRKRDMHLIGLVSLLFTLIVIVVNINYGAHSKDAFKDIVQSHNVSKISAYFLGTPYMANTLIGDYNTTEKFVINLGGVDCFTYIDYVESMRMSDTVEQFKKNLQKIRYKDAMVAYKNRNHFFSDWAAHNNFRDVTREISHGSAITVQKWLNKKDENSTYLKGIPIVTREITYLPTNKITPKVLDGLHTGDYIGIYASLQGLDVTHVGIVIKERGHTYFRHASSSKSSRKVITVDFMRYMKKRKGFVVLRPK